MKKVLVWIRNILYKIPLDKQLHVYYGDLFLPFYIILLLLFTKIDIYGAIAVGAIVNGIVTGFVKEELDKLSGGKFDIKDIFATLAGSIIGGLRLAILIYIIKNVLNII